MLNFRRVSTKPDECRIGDLEYGSIVTNLEGHRDSIYIKMNKRQIGNGIGLTVPTRHSLLFNPKCVSMRAVPYDSIVTVLKAQEVNVEAVTSFKPYLKH